MANKINTMQHISDEASSVTVDTKGTIWEGDDTIVNLQELIETMKPVVIKDVYASDTKYGYVKLAKSSDIEDGSGSDSDVVTSQQLLNFNGKPLASYTSYGTTRYSTSEEVISGTDESSSVNPKQLTHMFNTHTSKDNRFGTVKLSSESMVIPGLDNTTAMTPKLVKMAIDRLVPNVAVATESNTGTVQLATINVTLAGKIREGFGISPYSFSNSNGSTTAYGTVKMASTEEAYDSNIKDKIALSPATFQNAKATLDKRGTVHLASEAEVKAKTNADKAITPKSISYYTSLIEEQGRQITELLNRNYSVGTVPVGAMVESFVVPNVNTGFVVADGRSLSKSTYTELFNKIGYSYGGSGNNFNIPDTRGLYTRSTGKGKHITGALGNISGGGNVGTIQAQQVRRHKHITSYAENPSQGMALFGHCNTFRKGEAQRFDWDNKHHWTNDGMPWDGNPNPDGIIGSENRPWTITVYKLIRIK